MQLIEKPFERCILLVNTFDKYGERNVFPLTNDIWFFFLETLFPVIDQVRLGNEYESNYS